MIAEPGQRFGPYEIQARLGEGGMGHVFRAWDARLHREVAIKLLHDEFAMPDRRERFLREARAASTLNHPNICTIFDIGEQAGEPYLVMELLEGQTLKDRILQEPISTEDLIAIARETAEALAAAHAKGVVHRDIKPANLFLTVKPNGKLQAKVLDFGLAKIDGGSLGARGRHLDLTMAGSTVGTLAYMSPEQARGEELDMRSDLFSLGVVMYEMATRKTPFQGATSALVFVQLLNHPPEPVREWNDQIPRDLEKIILKLMAKERTARFQTAGELEQALRSLAEKPAGGGWLKKAIGTVPMGKGSEPAARERRSDFRKGSVDAETYRQAGDWAPRPSAHSESQVIRPITRIPPGDNGAWEGAKKASGSGRSGTGLEANALPARERYHPDPDQLFDLSMLRAQEAGLEDKVPAQAARSQDDAAVGRLDVLGDVPLPEEQGPAFPDSKVSDPAIAVPAGAAAHEAHSGFLEAVDEDEYEELPQFLADATIEREPAPAPERGRQAAAWKFVGLGLVIFAIALILFTYRGRFSAAYMGSGEVLVLTSIENHTGIEALDGSVAQGLQLDLEESPTLRIASSIAYRSALHQSGQSGEGGDPNAVRARAAAMRMGAKAYLYGTVSPVGLKDANLRGNPPGFSLRVDLLSVSNNDVLVSLEEHAESLPQIPAAIDRLADDVRDATGESSRSIERAHNSLTRETTGSLEALHTYSQGEDALALGRSIDATNFYQQTVALDPHFVQAQLRLVVLYRKQRAEISAAEAARAALYAANTTSQRIRTLAEYEFEMNASGNYVRATALIKQLVLNRPHDSMARADLARVERLQGKLAEALQSGQQAISDDIYNVDAYVQVSNTLIGLDRYDAALHVEEQAQRLGLARVGGSLIGGYLEDRQEIVDKAVTEYMSSHPAYRSDWTYGLYLDNSGRLVEGLALWRTNAAAARKLKGLESASAYLLAQGALDRALVGDCRNALSLNAESRQDSQGLMTLFNSGMAAALCGDRAGAVQQMQELQRVYPQSTDVQDYLLADLRAAMALDGNDPAAALEILRPVRQFDLISLTPFLRGRAHVALQQEQIGIVDFQTVLSHRGITFTVGTDVYPVAEIGVARAFAVTGDLTNSAAAYRHFLTLWKNADPQQPLLIEAKARSK